jgi:diguanylate cyclase (GGDEF)-like protein
MLGAPSDPVGAAPPRPLAGGSIAPGQIGLGVAALAAALAAIVAVGGDGQTFWLCVPAALAAAALCRTPRAAALAAVVTVLVPGAAMIADAHDRPPLWIAALVPAAAVSVLQMVRSGLERERDGMRDFALTDPLTRIANRRALLAQADHEVARHGRADRPFAVVMLDLDGFKTLNDRFGHAAGDDLLCDVAAALERAMRAQDTVARIGGDEFCVLAPETDAEGAQRLTARVTQAVRGVTAGVQNVRGSVGAAVFPDDALDPAQLIEVADARLLEAKRSLYRTRARGGTGERRSARHAA